MLVWTDGACQRNPGPGGWAALLCWEDGVVEEHSGGLALTTNNIMEMTAALEGLRALPSGSRVCVVTDSRYLHDGMTSWMAGWKRKGFRIYDSLVNAAEAHGISVQFTMLGTQAFYGGSRYISYRKSANSGKSTSTSATCTHYPASSCCRAGWSSGAISAWNLCATAEAAEG